MLTAKECLQSDYCQIGPESVTSLMEAPSMGRYFKCLALAHKIKELDTRAALLAFTYEFRTVAKLLELLAQGPPVRAGPHCAGRPASSRDESGITILAAKPIVRASRQR
jgi:hypothetical protein